MSEQSRIQNALDNGVHIKGTCKFRGSLEFDGTLEGDVESEGSFTVLKNADVRAEIKARSVIIFGKVTGNIIASERCELKLNGHLYGDLQTARLVIEEGATFVGKSAVAPEGKLRSLQHAQAEAATK